MPEPTIPGVHVDELPPRPRPIAQVETGTAAIVGPVPGNPAPTVVETERDLIALAGRPANDGAFLPFAAHGFFSNGGRRLLVIPSDFHDASLEAALAHLDARSDVGMLLAPDTLDPRLVPTPEARRAVEARLLAHADARRDKLFLLALPSAVTRASDSAVTGLPDSSFAACWHPWLTAAAGAAARAVPPVGHVAGLIARTDREIGVHQTPGNQAVRGLGEPPLLTRFADAAQAQFMQARVNIIRDFRAANRGIRLWSARTLSSDQELRQVNARRLLIMIEQSLAQGLQWAVFEPNDQPLWARLREAAATFLFALWQQGALPGDRPERAFLVRCDRTTMTEADIQRGRAVMLVGVALLKPAEFLIVRLALTTGAANA